MTLAQMENIWVIAVYCMFGPVVVIGAVVFIGMVIGALHETWVKWKNEQ